MKTTGPPAGRSPSTSTTTAPSANTRPSATSLRSSSNGFGPSNRKSPPVRQIDSTSDVFKLAPLKIVFAQDLRIARFELRQRVQQPIFHFFAQEFRAWRRTGTRQLRAALIRRAARQRLGANGI